MGEFVACIVPALNAGASVAAVLEGLRKALPAASVIGVDDGSSDATGEMLRRGCDHVVTHAANMGKGAALRAGFAVGLSMGATAVLTIDADGQHDPTAANTLLEALAGADVVIGARQRGAGMPLGRRLTNRMSAAAVSHCTGQPVPDSQSGFRAIRSEVVRTVRPPGDRYEFETAFLILAARAGFRIGSVPVATLYGAPSHFRPFRDAASVIRTIWTHRPAAMARCAS